MINQRLFKHYHIDTSKDLQIKKRCPRPFDTILIDKKGSCYACECQSWLPQSIGNLQVKPLEDIVGSDMHQHLRSSITDGTYRYCNQQQCSYLRSGAVLDSRPDRIKHLRLAIDDSCNLRCPSCRRSMVFHKSGPAFNLGVKLGDKINKWLAHRKERITVHMGSDGDPFASHVYRHFMEHTPTRANLSYSILTNGLMFKEGHTRVPHVIDRLTELGVSVDGASRKTYEKLRLGGKWSKLLEALDSMSELRQRQDFKFVLHFVVQKDNYHEMEDMIAMGERYGADRVWLNRIQDWGTTDNFQTQDIWDLPEYKAHLAGVLDHIHSRDDRFVECPTLISEEARDRGKN